MIMNGDLLVLCIICCRFNLHVADLSFLEGISRTLTSGQVRIKSEVAGSNTQSRKITDSISNLKSQLEEENVQVG